MAQDHRIIDQNGKRVPFSCENKRFCTNIRKGFPHQPYSQTLGSVLEKPLIDYGDASLWLEHVTDKDCNDYIYWLMWYDSDGRSSIPLSGVFGKRNLETMVERLTRFVP